MAPGSVILHTESSVGFGGQEIRIIAESRWLIAHGWRATIVGQPGARLLTEAARANVPALAVRMRGAWDLVAVLALLVSLPGGVNELAFWFKKNL